MPVQFCKNRRPPMLREGVGGNIKAPTAVKGRQMKYMFRSPVMYGVKYGISGVTRDSTGVALGNCIVQLFYTNNDVIASEILSDASGNYQFLVTPNLDCYIVAYKAGSPDVAGTTINTLRSAIT